MGITTFDEYKDQSASEKIGLVIVNAAKRVVGWTVHSGSIYVLDDFDISVIASLEDEGTATTEVLSLGAVVPGTYFNDRTNKLLYAELAGSEDPNTRFVALVFKNFYSNVPINAPSDPGVGAEAKVQYLPYLQGTSLFGSEIDSSTPQQGKAIESTGTVKFFNNQAYWKSIFDKLVWENQECSIYSYNRELPITEAKIIYKGRVRDKKWETNRVSFRLNSPLNELRQALQLDNLEALSGSPVLTDETKDYKQRRVYGYGRGVVCQSIDQVLTTGIPLSGTISVTQGSTTVTGVGTSFLADLSPNEGLFINGEEDAATIDVITSDTSLTLVEEWEKASGSSLSYAVEPELPKSYVNRKFIIAGHALREPATTVIGSNNITTFSVADITDFRAGDPVIVGTESSTVKTVSSNRIELNTSLLDFPTLGLSVIRAAVSNVYINDTLLQLNRDYTYTPSDGTLTLEQDAEVNVARIVSISGTSITLTSGLRTVTGVGTGFLEELTTNDFVSMVGHETEFFAVLSIESDTALTLRTASTYTDTAVPRAKRPLVYSEDTILTCDALGKTEDGLTTGVFIKTGPGMIKDLVDNDAGLSDLTNTASFTSAGNAAPQRLGLVIPSTSTDTTTPKIRDIIDDISKSIFGTFFENEEFQIEYNILDPAKPTDTTSVKEQDIISFKVATDSKRIVKTVNINYDCREYNFATGAESSELFTEVSDEVQFLIKSSKDFKLTTLLIDEADARIMAGRYRFMFERASSVIEFRSKLKPSRLHVTDVVDFKHEKLYDRFGSNIGRKVGAIERSQKSISDSSVKIDDLSAAFTRVANITENTANEFSASDEDELTFNGFITDNNGMQDNEETTFGLNVIF